MAEARFPGLILAGGLSRRMGSDKAGLDFGGRPLAAHVAARLSPQVSAVFVNADQPLPGLDAPLVPDLDRDRNGPLAGVLAGLRHLAATEPQTTHLLTVPVDCPFFPPDVAERLAAALTGPDDVAVARSRGALHPVFALWPVSAAGRLADFLAAPENRRVRAFLDRLPVRIVDFEDAPTPEGPIDPFLNLNTPEDAAQALRLLEQLSMTRPRIFGISGWKNSGKTGLAVRLVAEFTARGYRISTIKHAHHDFDIDKVGADSYRHREAGAHEVTIVSGTRYAIMHELRGAPEPSFDEILARLAPCDLVLIEGYKREPIPKIEARREAAANREPLSPSDPHIVAIAADHAVSDTVLPVFDLDDTTAIADFVAKVTGLGARG